MTEARGTHGGAVESFQSPAHFRYRAAHLAQRAEMCCCHGIAPSEAPLNWPARQELGGHAWQGMLAMFLMQA